MTATTTSVDHLQLTPIPSANGGMVIRRPAEAGFEAIMDPAIATQFLYTKSSGRLEPGATFRWEHEWIDFSCGAEVREVDQNRRILFDASWSEEGATLTLEFRFVPADDDATYVQVNKTYLSVDGDA